MALPINIDALIKRQVVESNRVEYKAGWNPEPIVHSICAFANDIDNCGGGYIILGVDEDNGMPKLPVKGLDKNEIDFINKDLLWICNMIEPRYIPVVEHTQFEGAEILVVWVPGGEDRPYKCPVSFPTEKNAKREKDHYIRKMSNSIRANANDQKMLFHISSSVPFDDRVNRDATLADLRIPYISNYLYRVNSSMYEESKNMSITALAANLRISRGSSEYLKPVNVGLMFFNERPDNFFPYARIEVVDKPDPTGNGMTEKVFTGPLDQQLIEALSYIRNYIIAEKVFKFPDRAEADRVFNYPYRAVEELLSNAVYHRGYDIREPITVYITPQNMTITSLPGPDRSITDEDLQNRKMVSSAYRNRRIGDFLKELHLIEGRNTGIPLAIGALRDNGSGLPVFETNADRTYFRVTIPVHGAFLPKKMKDGTDTVSGGKTRRNKEDIRGLIIKNLLGGEMAKSDLVKRMGYSKLNGTVAGVISDMLKEGIVAYTIPNNIHDANQKLRLAVKD
jgi:ATP-dependent DNA helicase RecG